MKPLFFCNFVLPVAMACVARAEFLFAPGDPSPNGFFTPTITFYDGEYEYSAWDVFYAPRGASNYPDIFAPAGGVWDEASGTWKPELRTDAGFPLHPDYNPSNPYAFWDDYNPTITQVKSTTTFIIGPDASGNIYTFQDKTGYQLHNHPDYVDQGAQLGTVIFQFQTDGTNVDFSNIRLGYKASDGNTYYLGVNDPQTEYLREYSTTGSDHWSATAGYRNRVLLQWDLSGVDGTGEFWIEWESLSSSMSFQKADLLTASYYEVGMPVSSTWVGTSGEWSDPDNWWGQAGGTPLENGNLKFKNADAATVNVDDASHVVGEVIFDGAGDVTLGGHMLTANTGITTRNGGTDAVYTFDTDYGLGALNFFDVNTGTVVMNGGISGDYGMVKLGAGALEFNGDNTFTGFLAVQGGILRLNGSNTYTGSTTVVNGSIIVANEAAFGGGASALAIGGDADLYAFTTGVHSWLAELLLDGDIRISRDITLGAGDLGKRLGALNTVNGAEFSGNISFSGLIVNPDAPGGASAVGNTRLTAEATADRLVFSGQMTGGASAKTVTVDGLGTVVYSGEDKTYNTSTHVASGTLLIENGTSYTGSGVFTVAEQALLHIAGGLTGSGDVIVNQGALHVDGILAGSGNLVLNGGMLSGSGTTSRSILADAGDVLSPGNGLGIMHTAGQTWGGGGSYLWEIGDLSGEAGTGWDTFDITGTLNITATESDRFTLRIASLDAMNLPGVLDGFDPAENYSWKIAGTSQGIAGFSGDAFLLDTDSFGNSFDGTFSLGLGLDGNDLFLNYAAAPTGPAVAEVALGGLNVVYDGEPKAATVSTVPPDLPVVVTYNGSETPPTAAGTYAVVAVVDHEDYSGSQEGVLVIARAIPAVSSWPAAGGLQSGQTLGEAVLGGGVADVPGVFAWVEPDVVPSPGVGIFPVQFVPLDGANYATVVNEPGIAVNVTAGEESGFAAWLGGVEPTEDLLRAYALGGTAEAGIAPPSGVIRDGNDLVLVVVVRMDDPNLSVWGEFVDKITDFGDAGKIVEIGGVASLDQMGVPEGFERREFRISMAGRSQGYLRLGIWLEDYGD